MRHTSQLPARVVWHEGMYLAPHHFQAQRRHFDDALALTSAALFPYPYGVAALALDEDALRNGTLALRVARGLLPDGTPFEIPDADPAPAPLALATHFAPTRDAHVVHLALPAWRPGVPNVFDPQGETDGDRVGAASANGGGSWTTSGTAELGDAGGSPRFVAVAHELIDEVSGRDPAPVRFATKNLRLVLDDALEPHDVSVPVARVRRDGAGRHVLDVDYVPPCLQIGASPVLTGLLQRMVGMLDAKGLALATTALPAGESTGASAYAGNEVATRWLLHAVRSAEAPLRHLLATRGAHPERLWLELVRLAGSLCTFSIASQARELPAYDHDDLTGCFAAIERHLRAHLDLVVASRAVLVPLVKSSEVLHVGGIADPRAFEPGARWFLAVRSAVGPVETAARVPTFAKACASRYVTRLVQSGIPGMPLEHLPVPPPGIAPRPDSAYFEIAVGGPCAQGLRDTREFGVYLPDAIPDAAADLVVLVPG